MPAANKPNVGPAAEARRRIGDQKAAERLEARGWALLPPDAEDDADLIAMLATAFETHGTGCDHNGEPACTECLARVAVQTLLAGRVL